MQRPPGAHRNSFRYPRIAVAHLREALLQQEYSGRAVAEIRAFVERFEATVAPAAIVLVSLLIGIAGYEHYERMGLRDAFLNAAMLLGGMGPVQTRLSEPGKVFAGLYALYSGLVFIVTAGVLLAPVVHRLLHSLHCDLE